MIRFLTIIKGHLHTCGVIYCLSIGVGGTDTAIVSVITHERYAVR